MSLRPRPMLILVLAVASAWSIRIAPCEAGAWPAPGDATPSRPKRISRPALPQQAQTLEREVIAWEANADEEDEGGSAPTGGPSVPWADMRPRRDALAAPRGSGLASGLATSNLPVRPPLRC